MHNYIGVNYVRRLMNLFDRGLIVLIVVRYRSDHLCPNHMSRQDSHSIAIPSLICASKNRGSFHVVQCQGRYHCH